MKNKMRMNEAAIRVRRVLWASHYSFGNFGYSKSFDNPELSLHTTLGCK